MATTTVTGYYFDDDPFKVVPGAIVYADDLNAPLASISSAFDTILDNIRTGSKIRSGEDTGTQNLYEINLDPPLSQYVEGQEIWLKGLNANTGASTLDINGVGPIQIKRAGLFDLQGDEISTTFYTGLKYCGGVFIITSETKRSIYDASQAISASINAAISENNAANCAAESYSSAIAAGIFEANSTASAAAAAASAAAAAQSAIEAEGIQTLEAGTGIEIGGTDTDATITNIAPNVTTDLDKTLDSTTVTITSSDGDNAVIPASTPSAAGIMTANDRKTIDVLSVENDFQNGELANWQRYTAPTVITIDTEQHIADRIGNFSSVSFLLEITRKLFTVGQTNVPGNPKYYHEAGFGTSSAASEEIYHFIRIKDVEEYSGKTVAFQFYGSVDTAKDIALEVTQNFGSGGSAAVQVSVDTLPLTTTFAKNIVFITFPSISGKTVGTLSYSEFKIWLSAGSDFNANTNSLGNQSGTLNLSEINIYESDVELPVRRRTPEESLTLCQAYYFQSDDRFTWVGFFISSTQFNCGHYAYPVQLIQDPEIVIWDEVMYAATFVSAVFERSRKQGLKPTVTVTGGTSNDPSIFSCQFSANAEI